MFIKMVQIYGDLITVVFFQDGWNTHKVLVGAPPLEGLLFPDT